MISRKKYWFTTVCAGFLAVVLAVYLWNTVQYNPYAAYDAGAHIDYIFTLAKDHHLPIPEENYLAWHEPLYYFIYALEAQPFLLFNLSEKTIVNIFQIDSAFLAWLFVVGAGLLTWLVTKRKNLTLFVLVTTGSLFCVSALARYVTNEIAFHAAAIWWLILFYYWEMYDIKNWQWKKWLIMILGLLILLWIKLTALVLILALLIWLLFLVIKKRQHMAIKIALILVLLIGFGYSPWLVYKYKIFGGFVALNTYETSNFTEKFPLPRSFFLGWDNDIMSNPFWVSGRNSFWSMFYASTLTDYDNIFGRDDLRLVETNYQTINDRIMTLANTKRTLLLFWWSLPLVFIILLGLVFYIWQLLKSFLLRKDLLLFITASGFLASLLYNVWQYPQIERGTLKAIFILTFFPLLFLLSGMGWSEFGQRLKHKQLILLVFWIYLIFWSVISFSVIVLPMG